MRGTCWFNLTVVDMLGCHGQGGADRGWTLEQEGYKELCEPHQEHCKWMMEEGNSAVHQRTHQRSTPDIKPTHVVQKNKRQHKWCRRAKKSTEAYKQAAPNISTCSQQGGDLEQWQGWTGHACSWVCQPVPATVISLSTSKCWQYANIEWDTQGHCVPHPTVPAH